MTKSYTNFPSAYELKITLTLLKFTDPAWTPGDSVDIYFKGNLIVSKILDSPDYSINCYDNSDWTLDYTVGHS